jgi:hypothetical protein
MDILSAKPTQVFSPVVVGASALKPTPKPEGVFGKLSFKLLTKGIKIIFVTI